MQTSNEERIEDSRVVWTGGEIATGLIALITLAGAGWYSVRHGLRVDELCLTLFVGSVLTLGAYDTRHNQPTQYNLLRSWPFGSATDDEQRGKRTVSSQALHALMCMSVCLCLLLIAFKRP